MHGKCGPMKCKNKFCQYQERFCKLKNELIFPEQKQKVGGSNPDRNVNFFSHEVFILYYFFMVITHYSMFFLEKILPLFKPASQAQALR